MPNHIQNRLVVTANSNDELNVFLSRIKSETEIDGKKRDIDFNQIIPMPLPLRNTEASSRTDDGIYYYLVKTNQDELISKILRSSHLYSMDRFSNRSEQELNELFEIGKKYVAIFNECGAKDWYDWSIYHWDTKWNAYETNVEVVDECSVILSFQTAWSGVPRIIGKLVEMFPTITFEYHFADEDMGTNCGIGYSDGGEFSFQMLISDSEESIETYALCWGYDMDNFYQDKDGYWHNREWEDEEEDDCEYEEIE